MIETRLEVQCIKDPKLAAADQISGSDRDKNSLKAVLFSIGEVCGRPRSDRAPCWTMISSMAGPRAERSWVTFSDKSSRRSTRHASV
jgi:hypothetical protein